MPRIRPRPAGAMVARLRRPAAAIPKAVARGARVPALAADGWYDSVLNPRAFDLMQSKPESGRLIEFEVKDGGGEKRGNVVAEIIGQRMTEKMGLSLLLISPLAAQDEAVREWMRISLTAPAGIVLCRGRASNTELGEERYHIQKVERLRILPRHEAQRGWARAQLATEGAPAQLLPRGPGGRADDAAGPGDESLLPPAEGVVAQREPEMEAVDFLRQAAMGAVAVPDGAQPGGAPGGQVPAVPREQLGLPAIGDFPR